MNKSYPEAAHAVQSGVKFTIELDKRDGVEGGTSPKHLRVGLDLRAADHAALAGLLIDKGIITAEEYLEAIRIETNREAERYEKELSHRIGKDVSLE